MTIYVIVQDYQEDGCSIPLGVFSSEDKAEEYIKLLPNAKYGPYEIHELTLDEWNEEWL